jgi:hypothetical protein
MLIHFYRVVGKGNHSAGHVQKIKPAVEQVCRDLGLQFATEENAGRIYVNLQGGDVSHMPPLPSHPAATHSGYGGQQQHGGGHQQQHYPGQQQQQHYPGQQQQHHGGQNNQEEQQYEEVEKFLVKIVKKYCCAVM